VPSWVSGTGSVPGRGGSPPSLSRRGGYPLPPTDFHGGSPNPQAHFEKIQRAFKNGSVIPGSPDRKTGVSFTWLSTTPWSLHFHDLITLYFRFYSSTQNAPFGQNPADISYSQNTCLKYGPFCTKFWKLPTGKGNPGSYRARIGGSPIGHQEAHLVRG
jgi:hypothetical protein